MKKLLFLAFIAIIITSCNKEEVPVKDYLVLSGKVDNLKKKEVTLMGFNFKKKIKFDKKTGTFVDSLKIEREGYYSLILNKKAVRLYLTKTDDTSILFDYKKPESLKFEGINAEINNYFIEKINIFKEIVINGGELFSLEEKDFLKKLDEYKTALTELCINSDLSVDFLKREVKNIDYECLRNLNNYQEFHGDLIEDNDFAVSENFPSATKNLNFGHRDDYVNSSSYRTLLKEELYKMAKDKNKEDEDLSLTHLETIYTEVNDNIAKNDLLYTNASDGITYAENLQEYYKKFMVFSTNESHKEEMTKNYNVLKTTAKGQPAPDFSNYENYNGGNTSLSDLLGKGKYLYIDVWATWCGYCKREIPLLKKLEEEYHGKNIEFVSINVDTKDKHEKWRETIEKREMTGVQLFGGDSNLKLKWAQNFLIKSLPRFIIVDPNGVIVSPNAPAPSQGEKLLKMFDKLDI